MKVEAGKFYKTRVGGKAYVGAVGCPFGGCHKNAQAVGWLIASDGRPVDATWSLDGSWLVGDCCDEDLVAIWDGEDTNEQKTVRVRIPVLVNTEGFWVSARTVCDSEPFVAHMVEDMPGESNPEDEHLVYVEADVPLPVAQVVEGRVEG